MQMKRILGILLALCFLMSVTAAAVSAGPVTDFKKVDDNKGKPGDDNKGKPGDDNKGKPGDDNKGKPGDDKNRFDDKNRKDRDDKARKDRDDKARKDRDDKKRHDDRFKPKGHWEIIKVKHVAWKHGHKFVWFTVKKVFVFNHFNGHFR
jgi:hypothetical protein